MLPVFAAVVSKTIVAMLSSHFHSLSKFMTELAIRSPADSELDTGRAGAPRSGFTLLEPKKEIYIDKSCHGLVVMSCDSHLRGHRF